MNVGYVLAVLKDQVTTFGLVVLIENYKGGIFRTTLNLINMKVQVVV